ncbi:MAG: MarR family winged helix-turn-helix transcriptional regulator [Solirubrobacteraceae bacterium]
MAASGEQADAQWESALLCLGTTIRSTFRAIASRRGRDTHLGGSELTYAQFELLLELGDRGELGVGELAAAAHLAPAAVTEMLDRLADSGHVDRTRSERDRRVVVSRLTAEGRRLVEQKRAYWRARWEQALSGFSASEMATATAVLQRLLAIYDEHTDVDASAREGSPRRGGRSA